MSHAWNVQSILTTDVGTMVSSHLCLIACLLIVGVRTQSTDEKRYVSAIRPFITWQAIIRWRSPLIWAKRSHTPATWLALTANNPRIVGTILGTTYTCHVLSKYIYLIKQWPILASCAWVHISTTWHCSFSLSDCWSGSSAVIAHTYILIH